ncbi:BolA/IbaG family iron-sulfur metabolism protein [Psittacicella melopsittaci]|uniref:BolA/IbaG family iron-sulfur metabolism protein n=1 Tax=Psittacicella melopsittaci TaxID=2028576 RepID=UPI001CA712C1|nr:BolA/IbaG family iron-sulfur metabolism protein [Psittacicella melopsittaci]
MEQDLLARVGEELKKLELEDFKLFLEGNHVKIVAVSELFNDMSLLKKQQYIMRATKPFLSSGEIHAVHIKTFTPEEWKVQKHLY